MKRLAVAYKGGRCVRCGYSRCDEALTFHHADGAKGYTPSWSAVRHELDRCQLLCAKCHIETHVEMHQVAALAGNG